jgi:hypothetical protein
MVDGSALLARGGHGGSKGIALRGKTKWVSIKERGTAHGDGHRDAERTALGRLRAGEVTVTRRTPFGERNGGSRRRYAM